jgi:hypothetical protein
VWGVPGWRLHREHRRRQLSRDAKCVFFCFAGLLVNSLHVERVRPTASFSSMTGMLVTTVVALQCRSLQLKYLLRHCLLCYVTYLYEVIRHF